MFQIEGRYMTHTLTDHRYIRSYNGKNTVKKSRLNDLGTMTMAVTVQLQ